MPGFPPNAIRTHYHQRQAQFLFNPGASVIHARSIYFERAPCSLALSACARVGEVAAPACVHVPFFLQGLTHPKATVAFPCQVGPGRTCQEINATRVPSFPSPTPRHKAAPFSLSVSLFLSFSPPHPSVLLGALIKNGVSVCCIFKWSWMGLNG